MLSGGLFASLALRSWCDSHRACMKIPEERVPVGCNLTKEFSVEIGVHQGNYLSPYCSLRFWKPSPKSCVQDVPGKLCMQMTWSSSLNRWGNCRRSWSSGRLTWMERAFGLTWAKPRSWCNAVVSLSFWSQLQALTVYWTGQARRYQTKDRGHSG